MNKSFKRQAIIFTLCLTLAAQLFPIPAMAAPAKTKNVIILLADGCGATHTTVSRWYKGSPLALEEIVVGAVRTYSSESLITDSAPAATAYAAGYKSNSKFIGVLPAKAGMPNVAFAEANKNFNRGDYNDIAEQQVNLNIDVVLGGGKQYLL